MRVVIIGLIAAAVALAGGTVFLLRGYLSDQEASIASMAPKELSIMVLVAAVDMPAGTPVNGSNVTWQGWPENGIVDEYIIEVKDKDVVADLEKDVNVVRRAIAKGEPILTTKLFKQDTPGFLRGSLKPGMRALAVRSSAESASAGFILPGDKVDIMLTHTLIELAMKRRGADLDVKTPSLNLTSETIMRDVLVLAIDQKVNEFEGAALVGKTILLEVSPKQAEILTTARAMGVLSMVLRSLDEGDKGTGQSRTYTTDIEVSPMLSSLESILAGEKVIKEEAPAPVKPVVRAAPKRKSVKINVYRGAGGEGN